VRRPWFFKNCTATEKKKKKKKKGPYYSREYDNALCSPLCETSS
jgi:hypothetical protein